MKKKRRDRDSDEMFIPGGFLQRRMEKWTTLFQLAFLRADSQVKNVNSKFLKGFWSLTFVPLRTLAVSELAYHFVSSSRLTASFTDPLFDLLLSFDMELCWEACRSVCST